MTATVLFLFTGSTVLSWRETELFIPDKSMVAIIHLFITLHRNKNSLINFYLGGGGGGASILR